MALDRPRPGWDRQGMAIEAHAHGGPRRGGPGAISLPTQRVRHLGGWCVVLVCGQTGSGSPCGFSVGSGKPVREPWPPKTFLSSCMWEPQGQDLCSCSPRKHSQGQGDSTPGVGLRHRPASSEPRYHPCVDAEWRHSSALMSTGPGSLDRDATLPCVGSSTLGKPITFSKPVS